MILRRLIFKFHLCSYAAFPVAKFALVQILNSFSNFLLKTEIFSNEERGVNIDQSAMCYISMDLS